MTETVQQTKLDLQVQMAGSGLHQVIAIFHKTGMPRVWIVDVADATYTEKGDRLAVPSEVILHRNLGQSVIYRNNTWREELINWFSSNGYKINEILTTSDPTRSKFSMPTHAVITFDREPTPVNDD